ncbi:hypothetical protein [Bacteroides propionicifaciens]|jgi:hypothetical protein|uniref:NigD1/NigD2 family lipoprotein n=1 Tax=Bacteroides propionicifaciens TaxID=392838 RepID=UPI00046927A8|nr:NigD-like C-terminal domain-containing protein [Bacteroides propionicifaciens]
MKKIITRIILSCLVIMSVSSLQSCNDDGYSLGDFYLSYATVKRGTNTYYLQLDSGDKLWVAAGYLGYNGVDGQRVIADYTILSDKQGEFAHYVKVNNLWNILTKNIEKVETEKQDEEFGNNKLFGINEMWFGGGYININFSFFLPQVNRQHRISLVENLLNDQYSDDGYLYLELRYNSYNNESDYVGKDMVSFNTNNVNLEGKKGFKIIWKNAEDEEVIQTLEVKKAKPVDSEDMPKLNQDNMVHN